ncbi:DMT family transporter [Microbacterium sp. USHLN186]|uniref:DMT family transporter n=1 Tax=Microbacterium sp. USHLN186 TaxID=3081286 RepID=UPI0030193D26
MAGIVRGDHPGRARGLLAIAVTSLLWGTTGTAATFSTVGPFAIGAAALGIGGLLQAVVAIPALRGMRSRLWERRAIVAVGALAVAVYPLAFYSSMHLAGVAVGSVVSLASAPLFSGVLERVIDKRPLSRSWMLAALLGVLGSVLLCVSRLDSGPQVGVDSMVGVAVGLVAGATYATYSWASRRLMDDGVDRGAAMGAVFGVGGLLLMPVLVITGAPLISSWQNAAVGAYMALVPMFLGYLLFGYGLTKIPSSTATTVTLTEPAVATLLAVLIVGERLDAVGWTGIATIGVVLIVLALAPTGRSRTGET